MATALTMAAQRLPAIRMMGSGPRTHPGGISDREWRREQRRQLRVVQRELRRERKQAIEQRHEQFKALKLRLRELGNVGMDSEDYESPAVPRFETWDGRPSHRCLPPHAIHSTKLYRQRSSPVPLSEKPVMGATLVDEAVVAERMNVSSMDNVDYVDYQSLSN